MTTDKQRRPIETANRAGRPCKTTLTAAAKAGVGAKSLAELEDALNIVCCCCCFTGNVTNPAAR